MRLQRLERLRLRFFILLDQKIGREKKIFKKYITKLDKLIEEENEKTTDVTG